MLDFFMLLIIPDGCLKGAGFYNSIIRKIARFFIILKYKYTSPNSIKMNNKDEPKVIVSLTSFGDRVNELHLCLNSIFRQTIMPDKIVLWLSKEEYNDSTIPLSLNKFINLGLEINYCEDLRSHKKYYGSLTLWPDDIIVTVDDDVFYQESMLEGLLNSYLKYPHCISCYRAHSIRSNDEGVLPYIKWGFASPGRSIPNHDLLAVGVGGVLYPPNSLHNDVLKSELFKKLSFYADDLWLKFMAFKANSKIVKVKAYSKTLISTSKNQTDALSDENVVGGRNDLQLSLILNHYDMSGDEFLKEEK